MTILLILATAGTLAYLSLLAGYNRVALQSPPIHAGPLPFITVVVAARNEADNIDACIQSILTCGYPTERFELIVVDDQSTDATSARVRAFPEVVLLQTTSDTSGKKAAIASGIRAAKGTIIALTDADCIVPSGWLQGFAAQCDARCQIITGPVLCHEVNTAFTRFQALDLIGLARITTAGIRQGKHHLANGANMAFRISAYDSVHGYDQGSAYASGDDVFLVQSIAAQFPDGVRVIDEKALAVLTRPCATWSQFFRQRVRWASKNAGLRERNVHQLWMVIWLIFIFNTLALIVSAFVSMGMVVWSCILLLSLWTGEWFFLRSAAKQYGQMQYMKGFAVSALLHHGYVLAMGFLYPFSKNYIWKDRRVR